MKLLSLIWTIVPAAATMLLAEQMGLLALIPALLLEGLCLFGIKKTAPEGIQVPACCAVMEIMTLLTAIGSVGGQTSSPAELGAAVLILSVVFHLVMYLTMCGFMLNRKS